MKKAYESPKAEKMEFDYSEVVVASGKKCDGGITIDYVEGYSGCREREKQTYNEYGTEN